MTTLIAGLVLFIGIHLLPMAPALRGRLATQWGEPRYKGFFSLVSFAGFALIIAGYWMGERGAQLFAPAPAARSLAPYAMAVSFVLLAAANMRGRLRQTLRHPMLLGILIWAGVHLLANGDTRGTLLFGAFFAYALVDLVSVIARGAVKTFEPVAKHDVIAVLAGIVLALLVMAGHRLLFGVKVVSFGW